MKAKRIVALMLVAMMSISCLAGCNNSSDSKTTEAPQKETDAATKGTEGETSGGEETTQEVVQLEEKTIQIMMLGPGKQKDSDKVWEAFNEMLQDYVPNTTVEFTIVPAAEYTDRFNRMLAAEEKYDLAWIGYKAKPASHIADENLMPLDDLLEQYGQGIIETLGEKVLDMNRYDGKLYYLISWQGLTSNKYAFWVPTELANLAGNTWATDTQAAITKWWDNLGSAESGDNYNAVFDQMDKYLGAAKAAGKLYSGIQPNYSWGSWNGWKGYTKSTPATNNVGVIKNEDGKYVVVDGIQSAEKRVWAKRMSEFYEKGYLRSDIASVDLSTLTFVSNGEYNANTVIFWTQTLLSDSAEITKEKAAGVDLTYLYREEAGELGKGDSTGMAVPYCADDPERAMMVLNALYTVPELYQLLIYGIEGEHYTDNGDGTITTPYGAEGTSDADYGLTRWAIGTCLNSLVTQNDVKGHYESLKAADEAAEPNLFATFSLDKTNIQDILTALSAIDKTYSQMVDLCASGAEIEAALDKWIAERKAAGVDKVIEEMQKQIDEYVKTNNIK